MTQEHAHQPSGSLGMAITLALVAGFVDANVYVDVTPVFVSNMSGNLVHLGIFLGSEHWRAATGSLIALTAFLLGVLCAVSHHDRSLRHHSQFRSATLLTVESFLLLALAALRAETGVSFTRQPTQTEYMLVALGAVAMGLQAATLRRVGQIAVATTYGTGAFVRVGEKLALAIRRSQRLTQHRRRVTIAVLVSILASYCLGAGLAALAGHRTWAPFVPGSVLTAVALAAQRQERHLVASPANRAWKTAE